MIFCCFENMAS